MGERRHTKVTLIKVPRMLQEHLEEYKDPIEIGTLEEKNGKTVFRVSMSVGPNNFPREWTLESLEKKNGLFTFTQKQHSASVDGQVIEEMYLRPQITPEYLQYKRERQKIQTVKKEVKMVDSLREGIRIEKYGASEYDLMARRRKKLLLDRKRERLAKAEVMDILFRAFEEYPYWSLKDLSDRSGQPQAYIQEILSEIAIVNKKTQKNMYELKPEYKNN
ncbi:transcription initiation factor TFIIF subunit beta [Nematocida sp. AWRm80]|nr:transcription initiation factor TFIIF subunit beta [Nematocida sp. AWRm80]